MSGKENKRSRSRKTPNSHSKVNSNTTQSNTSVPLGQLLSLANDSPLSCEVPSDFIFKSTQEDSERITELMDAPLDFDIPAHAISKGPNPYLDRCMYCNTLRTTGQDGDEGTEFLDLQLDGNTVLTGSSEAQSFGSVKLEIWTCPTCRKVAGNFQSFLEANLPQATYDEALLSDQVPCMDSFSCTHCDNGSSDCRNIHAEETKELQMNWIELRTIVKNLHTCTDEPALSEEEGDRLMFLIEKLCHKDPHQLFLRLESQVREMVIEIKTSLLQKLTENGVCEPATALDFTSALLCHYDIITRKAHLLAQYLGGLTDHLKQFQVTWELLNKHLFHSIAHNDPAISCVGPTILEQLRQGSLQYERSRDDPFCTVRKRLLKFQEEMSVVVVVWRDCQQLIENYCQEEFTNTQKQVSHRAKSFITQQRQLLKNHLMKDSFMDEETMKSLVSGHKSSTEKVLCHRCKRERCTCDECTITHMITCGIISTEQGTTLPPPPSSFNFALDHHTHNVMDITPPSMSSTTSSSGSVSPINVEDKIAAYYDCERVLSEELRDAMLSCDGKDKRLKGLTLDDLIDNIDDNAGDDEDEDIEDAENCIDQQDGSDEPHAMQLPMWGTLDAHQLFQSHKSNEHDISSTQRAVPHSCAQCHQFQPRIDSHLSKQLEAEIASSGVVSNDMNEYVANNLVPNSADQLGSDGDVLNPNMCAACQCHACLKQSGHVVSTSLPLQVPVSPPPAELNLYPHIHGLPPQRYMFGLPSPLLSSIKLPLKLDFEDPSSVHDHIYHAYSDWDNPRPGSLAAQHQHQPHHRLSGLTSDLLPPAPVVDAMPAFSFETLSLATHSSQTPTNTTSATRSTANRTVGGFVSSTTNGCSAEGSSVDPTTKPLNFSSMLKLPQACLNTASLSHLLTSSVPSAVNLSVASNSHMTTSVTASKAVNGSCQGPPSSRPIPLGGNTTISSKWEKTHSLQCKKFTGAGPNKIALLNQQGDQPNPFSITSSQVAAPFSVPQNLTAPKNLISNHHLKSVRSSQPCPHSASNITAKSCGGEVPSLPVQSQVSTPNISSSSSPSSSCLTASCANANLPSTVVNNIGVGTSAPCMDTECKVHHDENCDSVDDSCSERSSSTSSNQKEGKYCDCCYCEFFGHNNPQGAKTSPNYFEMKDRLRKKLKKKNETKYKSSSLVQCTTPHIEVKREEPQQPQQPQQQQPQQQQQPPPPPPPPTKVPMEKRGLDELLNFINGTEDGAPNKATTKAAKRARQKQRKMEEKAQLCHGAQKRVENHHHPEVTKSLTNFLFKPSSDTKSSEHLVPKLDKAAPSDQERINELQKKLTLLKEEMKQETTRSSMIIESTRPTISRSPVTKNGNNIDKVLDMIHQTLKHTQQSQHTQNNGKKAQPPVSVSPTTAACSNDKTNGTDKKMNGSVATKAAESKKMMSTSVDIPISQAASVKQAGKSQSQHSQAPQASKPSKNQKPVVESNNSPSRVKAAAQTNSGEKKNTTASSNGNPTKQSATLSESSRMNSPKGLLVTSSVPISKGLNSSSATTVQASSGSSTSSSSSGSNSKAAAVANPGQSPRNSKILSEPASSKPKVASEQTKAASGKSKKNKKKSKTENGDVHDPEEVFMPKSQEELDGSIDDFERELEEFKRFCFENSEPKEKRKLAVNVNLKDIFKKKSTFA